MIYILLADTIVTIHFCYVLFTVGGELAILLGGILRWRPVRNRTFRIIHLCCVTLVALEAAAGMLCPLTEWEYRLRELGGQRVEEQIGFVPRLIRSIIFYDFPSWVFTVMYVGFGALVIITFFLVRPEKRKRRAAGGDGGKGGSHGG